MSLPKFVRSADLALRSCAMAALLSRSGAFGHGELKIRLLHSLHEFKRMFEHDGLKRVRSIRRSVCAGTVAKNRAALTATQRKSEEEKEEE